MRTAIKKRQTMIARGVRYMLSAGKRMVKNMSFEEIIKTAKPKIALLAPSVRFAEFLLKQPLFLEYGRFVEVSLVEILSLKG